MLSPPPPSTDVILGFEQLFFSFEEDVGNLTNVFSVELIGGVLSQQDITFGVEIFVNRNATSATEGHIGMCGT